MKTRLGVDEEGVEGVAESDTGLDSRGVGFIGSSGATTPNGIGANDSSTAPIDGILNGGDGDGGGGGGGGGGDSQPRLSAFEVGT